METERQQLERALILNRRFDEARAILKGMAGNATADQWLAKLDEIAPAKVPPPPVVRSTPVGAPPPVMRTTPASQTVNLTLDAVKVRYGIAAFVALMALLMIVGFFVFPWLDLSEVNLLGFDIGALANDEDQGLLKVTAMELWMGENNGEEFTLKPDEQGGFANVRLVDRFLILTPIGALGLLWLAWRYAIDAAVRRPLLIMMTFLAFLLYAWPGTWEDLSTRALKDSYRDMMDTQSPDELDAPFAALADSMIEDMFTDTYSTSEQEVLGILAFLAGLVGLGLDLLPQIQEKRKRATMDG